MANGGYDALRVEEVVLRAGVAKGTFFAHFRDKDALMDLLIGAQLNSLMDDISKGPVPNDVPALIAALRPLHNFMTCERYVFDVILRYSGAAAIEEIGAIAQTFERYLFLVRDWIEAGSYRQDVSAMLLAEGVQAFAVQTMALHFCALHTDTAMDERLIVYLKAWLTPTS